MRDQKHLSHAECPLQKGVSEENGRDEGFFSEELFLQTLGSKHVVVGK